MRKFHALLAALLAVGLAGCKSSLRTPETASAAGEQKTISPEIKRLYIACSAASGKPAEQQRIVRQMAEKAVNGPELLMVMRAGIGVFPHEGSSAVSKDESAIRSMVAAKMIQAGTLEELTQYAVQYPINREDARPVVEKMFQLASAHENPAMWQNVARAARAVSVPDLAQQAQGKSGSRSAR